LKIYSLNDDMRQAVPKEWRDLEQIKFLLGHSSIQTTERYLGSEQDIEIAVNDNLAAQGSFERKAFISRMTSASFDLKT
jgi:hypothetical protein